MEKIREILNRKGVLPVLTFIAGLIIGLVVLGWGLFPVQWTNGSPADLSANFQKDYLRMAVQSFSNDPNPDLALQRWSALGSSAVTTMKDVEKDPVDLTTIQIMAFTEAIAGSGQQAGTAGVLSNPSVVVENTKPADANAETAAPAGSETASGDEGAISPTETLKPKWRTAQAEGTQQAAATTPEPVEATATGTAVATITAKTGTTGASNLLPVALGAFCLLTLILAGVLFYVFVFRKRKTPKDLQPSIDEEGVGTEDDDGIEALGGHPRETYTAPSGTPISQFMTTFMIGDDVYDDSFSIDSPLGEFLGECGVGISDTIGVGDPKKVSAFEVWLFDKNDIQTVTKVLMSEHSFADQGTVQKLRAKGEPVLAEAGKRLILETATLQLEARIVDLNYGQGALPTNSYFDRMTLELAIWPKQKISEA
jgi:hypothetical protein